MSKAGKPIKGLVQQLYTTLDIVKCLKVVVEWLGDHLCHCCHCCHWCRCAWGRLTWSDGMVKVFILVNESVNVSMGFDMEALLVPIVLGLVVSVLSSESLLLLLLHLMLKLLWQTCWHWPLEAASSMHPEPD